MNWGHVFYNYQVMNQASHAAHLLAQSFFGKFQEQALSESSCVLSRYM